MRFVDFTKTSFLICLLVAGTACQSRRPSGITHPASPLTAHDVIHQLHAGNCRYLAGKSQHPRQTPDRRSATLAAQHPIATVIACSDSRVPVEQIFDQGIGDLFVVRVIGNVADTAQIGSAEYGASHLHTPIVMVLGHTHCGAVTAAVKGADVHGSIPAVLSRISLAAHQAKADGTLTGDALIARAIRLNVFRQLEQLLARSPEIRDLAARGQVHLVGALYDLDTGRVDFLGAHPQQKQILARSSDPRRSVEPLYGAAPHPPAQPPAAPPSRSHATASTADHEH